MRSLFTYLPLLIVIGNPFATGGFAQQVGPYALLPLADGPPAASAPLSPALPNSEEQLPLPAARPTPPTQPAVPPLRSPFPPAAKPTPGLAPVGPQPPLSPIADAPAVADDSDTWWEAVITQPLRSESCLIRLDVETLWKQTLQHSEQVLAIRETPLIERENIVQAQADFDPTTYLQTKFKHVNEPVGNQLTTGGAPRFINEDWDFAAGMRKKITSGGQVDVSQSLGFENSNSIFFTPQDQGTGRLLATYRQPLLKGAGWCYNQSFIVLAEVNTRTAEDQFTKQLHEQLVLVTKGYWQLYYQRAWLLQQRRHLARVEEVLASLEARREIDTIESQIVRARAALASRRANLTRAEAAVRDAEARLRALVNGPEMLANRGAEMIPLELPHRELMPINQCDSMKSALRRRPELDAAVKRIDAARVKLAMSENELLPSLSFLVDGYVAGLEGNSRVGQSVANQFSRGGPGYSAGLFYEMPWGNRAAEAKNRQQVRELTQAGHQFKSALENLATEVEVAVREIATSHQEYLSKRESVAATRVEVVYLQDRWSNLAGDDRSASLLLEDILQAQDRLVDEERTLAQALVNYNVAMTEWKRVTGNMVNMFAYCENNVPVELMHSLKCVASERVSQSLPAKSKATAKTPPVPVEKVKSFTSMFSLPPIPNNAKPVATPSQAPAPRATALIPGPPLPQVAPLPAAPPASSPPQYPTTQQPEFTPAFQAERSRPATKR